MGTVVFKVPHLKIIEPLVIITLILPITLWAATPCSLATQNVIKVYHLRQTLSLAQQKTLLQQAVNLCPNHAQAHNNLGTRTRR